MDKNAVSFKYIKIKSWGIVVIGQSKVGRGRIVGGGGAVRIVSYPCVSSTKDILLCNADEETILQGNK